MEGYIMTIDSDGEDASSNLKGDKDAQLDLDFTFVLENDPYIVDEEADTVQTSSKPAAVSVDDIIARRNVNIPSDEDEEGTEDESEDSSSDGESDEDRSETTGAEPSSSKPDQRLYSSDEEEDEEETQAELNRKASFFDSSEPSTDRPTSFTTMNLSRPILKSLTSLNFQKPTPIQAATIPAALLGKDIVGSAVTGSGKTAAFIVPMLERLLYREKGKKAAATRCLILVPTRELAVQCHDVGTKLASQTDIQFCLTVGGLSLKAQETALRNRPDVVVATPGRLIDHLHNSVSFTLDALDILVLDEADRMLEDGFAAELNEIIRACPASRQTMLFSATMTDSVDELVRMSLNKPVRLFVDPKRSLARGLTQEFVRVRTGKESDRSAILVSLCKRTFKNRTIIFLRSKKLAHQLRILFGLLGMKCGELHGDLTQEQRLQSLRQFRDGSIDYLMATDLASRGLDIRGVETVINYDMPGQLAQYLHRVGRTARAGAKGRSVTLVGEADRKLLKAAIKHGQETDLIRHRLVSSDNITKWSKYLERMKTDMADILQEEKEEKQIRQAEMELRKGENMVEHSQEIYSRPARTWFQSEREKGKAQAISKKGYEEGFGGSTTTLKRKTDDTEKPRRDKFSGLSRKAKRRKLATEEDQGASTMDAAIRKAKKEAKPPKIGQPEMRQAKSKAMRGRKKAKLAKGASSNFSRDLGQKGYTGEGARARTGDLIRGVRTTANKRV